MSLRSCFVLLSLLFALEGCALKYTVEGHMTEVQAETVGTKQMCCIQRLFEDPALVPLMASQANLPVWIEEIDTEVGLSQYVSPSSSPGFTTYISGTTTTVGNYSFSTPGTVITTPGSYNPGVDRKFTEFDRETLDALDNKARKEASVAAEIGAIVHPGKNPVLCKAIGARSLMECAQMTNSRVVVLMEVSAEDTMRSYDENVKVRRLRRVGVSVVILGDRPAVLGPCKYNTEEIARRSPPLPYKEMLDFVLFHPSSPTFPNLRKNPDALFEQCGGTRPKLPQAVAAPTTPVSSGEMVNSACGGSDFIGCYNLGVALYLGNDVPVDKSAARTAFQKACDGNNLLGCAVLGGMMMIGEGGPKDRTASRVVLEKSCSGNEQIGCLNLAILLASGPLADQDRPNALEFARKACNLKNPLGCRMVAVLLFEGTVADTNDRPGARIGFRAACDMGDLQSCTSLALMTWLGEGGPQNQDEARGLWNLVCSKGEKSSCAALGEIEFGDGNDELARKMLTESCGTGAQQDSGGACLNLGFMAKALSNKTEATRFFELACSTGQSMAGCYAAALLKDDLSNVSLDMDRLLEECDLVQGALSCHTLSEWFQVRGNLKSSRKYHNKAHEILKRYCARQDKACCRFDEIMR